MADAGKTVPIAAHNALAAYANRLERLKVRIIVPLCECGHTVSCHDYDGGECDSCECPRTRLAYPCDYPEPDWREMYLSAFVELEYLRARDRIAGAIIRNETHRELLIGNELAQIDHLRSALSSIIEAANAPVREQDPWEVVARLGEMAETSLGSPDKVQRCSCDGSKSGIGSCQMHAWRRP